MSMGLDSEGLLSVYADWIAFLSEKRATLGGQLTKLQAKDGQGKEGKTGVSPLKAEKPASSVASLSSPEVAPVEEPPAWLFSAEPEKPTEPEGQALPEGGEEDKDEWM